MNLVLDVHHSPVAAARLGDPGHDVTAAAGDPALESLADEHPLEVSTNSGRVLVTENARDFDRIVRVVLAETVRTAFEGAPAIDHDRLRRDLARIASQSAAPHA